MPITKSDLFLGIHECGTIIVVAVPADNETFVFQVEDFEITFEFSETDPDNDNIWIDTSTYTTPEDIAQRMYDLLHVTNDYYRVQNGGDNLINYIIITPLYAASFTDNTGGDVITQRNVQKVAPQVVIPFHIRHVVTAQDVINGKVSFVLPFGGFVATDSTQKHFSYRIQESNDSNLEIAFDGEVSSSDIAGPQTALTYYRVLTFANLGGDFDFAEGNVISLWGQGTYEAQ